MKTIAQQLNIKKFPFEIKDSKGRIIYFENSEGGWYRSEYDSNGKQIHHEDSNGYWCKREYDSNGNRTYYESSNGFWGKKEYDSQGNEIYYENSDGTIIDKRPKPCEGKTVEIDGITYKLTKE
jgi:uncharacterized protein RhaS with RHS repeats